MSLRSLLQFCSALFVRVFQASIYNPGCAEFFCQIWIWLGNFRSASDKIQRLNICNNLNHAVATKNPHNLKKGLQKAIGGIGGRRVSLTPKNSSCSKHDLKTDFGLLSDFSISPALGQKPQILDEHKSLFYKSAGCCGRDLSKTFSSFRQNYTAKYGKTQPPKRNSKNTVEFARALGSQSHIYLVG